MQEFLLNIILSNPWYILGLFVVLVSLSHLLVYPRNLPIIWWKRIDYVWLFIAALGLFGLSSDVRVFIAKGWLEQDQVWATSALTRFQNDYSGNNGTSHCIKFVRSEFSPNDFDERQRQQDLICSWRKAISKVLSGLNVSELPELTMANFPEPDFDQVYGKEEIKNFRDQMAWYGEARDRYVYTKSLTSKGDGENLMFYFSPFFLCIALALRIAKVTGELRHEMDKKDA